VTVKQNRLETALEVAWEPRPQVGISSLHEQIKTLTDGGVFTRIMTRTLRISYEKPDEDLETHTREATQ